MKALSVITVLLLACSLSSAETRQPYPVLILNVGNVSLGVYPPSGDSVNVSVYMENILDPVGAFDVWLSLGHEEVFRLDTVVTSGTAIADWEIEQDVISSQIHVFANGNIEGGTPMQPGVGQHLLMRLIAKVREDRLDPDGTVVDSMCDSPYYELYGVTPIYIDSAQFWTEDSTERIGCIWGLFCADSICTEWDGDSCIAWECVEFDYGFVCDSTAVYFFDGAITLDCSNCGDLIIGDANASGDMDIDDVVYLIDYIFTSGPSPVPRVASGDANCDCEVDIDDVVYLIAYIFTGGPPPQCSCEEWVAACGQLH